MRAALTATLILFAFTALPASAQQNQGPFQQPGRNGSGQRVLERKLTPDDFEVTVEKVDEKYSTIWLKKADSNGKAHAYNVLPVEVLVKGQRTSWKELKVGTKMVASFDAKTGALTKLWSKPDAAKAGEAETGLNPFDFEIGQTGALPRRGWEYVVARILDDKDILVKSGQDWLRPVARTLGRGNNPQQYVGQEPAHSEARPFLLRGLATQGLADGSKLKLEGTFKVSGTKKLDDGRTLLVLERVAAKEAEKKKD
jgi:hypothetical protein